MDQAELLLVLLDGSVPLSEEDQDLLAMSQDKRRIVVVNKIDLPDQIQADEFSGFEPIVRISATTGEGLDDLRDAIRHAVLRADFEPGERAIVTRARHRASLLKAGESLEDAMESVHADLSGEFVAMDVRGALDALGEITGAVTTDDILDRIFSEFCIGK
jgi:tRNA modification GTPase